MASVEIGPLANHLDDDEVKALQRGLSEHGLPELENVDDGESNVLDPDIDDDVLADFLDRLDANDAACDIYLPSEFEDVVEAAGKRVGSAHALMLALDGLKDDFFVEDEDDEEDEDYEEVEDDEEGGHFVVDDEPSDIELKDEQLRSLWKLLYKGAKTCVSKGSCLFIHA
jgi:hypothetical protein